MGPDHILRVEYNGWYIVIALSDSTVTYVNTLIFLTLEVINKIRTKTQIDMNDRKNKVEELRIVHHQYELETTMTYKKKHTQDKISYSNIVLFTIEFVSYTWLYFQHLILQTYVTNSENC